MTRPLVARRLLAATRASIALEFAIVGPVLFLVTFGTVDLGMILWTQGALQYVAADAARCGAIGAAACTGNNSMQSYVQTQAANWIMNAVSADLTVKVNTTVNTTACPAISTGKYETVEIATSDLGSWLPWTFANYAIDVCASYAT
ncbi:MAG TPA: TadE/TadG family type IV pilus assembly protein [Acetobacteraceae bacterium]|nr:TadE/TadG family type IV pilus assembly protein [Acetobacteraceae bacterium]